VNVPPSTICPHSASYSSCEPSTQWMRSGSVSRAIFSTHLRRWWFLLNETDGSRQVPDTLATFELVAGLSDGVFMGALGP
jgi:hypothetical protein